MPPVYPGGIFSAGYDIIPIDYRKWSAYYDLCTVNRGDRDRGSDREIFYGGKPSGGRSVTFIQGFMDFTHVQNTGAAFSMFSNGTWLLALLSAVMAAVVIFLLFK